MNKICGYSAGNNIGIKYLEEKEIDYIIISNPDVIFTEEDIINLSENFKRNEKIALIAPVINEHGILNRGWKFQSSFMESLTNINFIGRYFKKKRLYKDSYYSGDYSKVDVVSGCFFIIKQEVIKKIGYLDEKVFLYYEENILAKKLQRRNYDIIVDNKVQIIHNHSVSVNKSLNKIKKFKNLAKSQRYYNKKYNNAGFFGMLSLYVSYFITIVISYVLSLFGK